MQTLSSTFIFSYRHNRKKRTVFLKVYFYFMFQRKLMNSNNCTISACCVPLLDLHTFRYWQHFRILAWCVAICGVRTWAVFILKYKVGHPQKVRHDAFAANHGVRCTMLPHYVSWVRLVNSYCFGPSHGNTKSNYWNNLQVKHRSRWYNTTKGWL